MPAKGKLPGQIQQVTAKIGTEGMDDLITND